MKPSYGCETFVPATHFVKAKYHDPRTGLVSEGFRDGTEAFARARELSERDAVQDVAVIAEGTREVVVHVLRGVQWFIEKELHAKYPGRWRRHDDPAIPDVLRMPDPLPTAHTVIVRRVVTLEDGTKDTVEEIVGRDWEEEAESANPPKEATESAA